MTEHAARQSAPRDDFRSRLARRLSATGGEGDPAAAWIAGLAAEQAAAVRALLPRSWSRAAVLVPIVEHDAGPTVLLTQRASHLTNHPGQISFPGGRMEPGDAGPWEAAIRETEEEIGIGRDRWSLAGFLRDHLVISGYIVTPAVGVVRPGFELNLDPTEVEDVFEVPLGFLLDEANHLRTERRIGGQAFPTWDIPWQGRRIWGATAGMLVSLADVLRGY